MLVTAVFFQQTLYVCINLLKTENKQPEPSGQVLESGCVCFDMTASVALHLPHILSSPTQGWDTVSQHLSLALSLSLSFSRVFLLTPATEEKEGGDQAPLWALHHCFPCCSASRRETVCRYTIQSHHTSLYCAEKHLNKSEPKPFYAILLLSSLNQHVG